jgi:putative oxidoreductase
MLNTFPSLLTFGLLAPFILRLVLGIIFLYAGYMKITRKDQTAHILSSLNYPNPKVTAWVLGLIQVVSSVALIVGFLTQIAAGIILIISLGGLIVKTRHGELIKQSIGFSLFAVAISASLIFTGAGFWAFDLPL